MWISRIFTCFPGGSVVKYMPANARDPCSIPGPGRCPGIGKGNPLQYSCLGNPMNRGTWRATLYWVIRVRHNLETKQKQQQEFCGGEEGKVDF